MWRRSWNRIWRRPARGVLFRQANAAERATVFEEWCGKAAKRRDVGARIALLLPRPGQVRLAIDPTPTTFLETTLAIGIWLLENQNERAKYIRPCYFVRCQDRAFILTPKRQRPHLYCPDKDCEGKARFLRESTDPKDAADRAKQRKRKGSYGHDQPE